MARKKIDWLNKMNPKIANAFMVALFYPMPILRYLHYDILINSEELAL